MEEFIKRLREKVMVGLVGGSDLVKIREQMGQNGGDGELRKSELLICFNLIFKKVKILPFMIFSTLI